MATPVAQIVTPQTLLMGTFVLILLVTAVLVFITYRSLHSDVHTPAGLRDPDSEDVD